MYSGGNPVGDGGSLALTRYFCHQCNRMVNISPSPASNLVCPTCNGGFLEEIENPNPNPMLNPFFASSDSRSLLTPSLLWNWYAETNRKARDGGGMVSFSS